MQRIGSRAQVMHGNAKMTGGGLKKKDLKYNKQGKIVSKKMSTLAKKEKKLQKAGFKTKKGEFKLFQKQTGGASGDNALDAFHKRQNKLALAQGINESLKLTEMHDSGADGDGGGGAGAASASNSMESPLTSEQILDKFTMFSKFSPILRWDGTKKCNETIDFLYNNIGKIVINFDKNEIGDKLVNLFIGDKFKGNLRTLRREIINLLFPKSYIKIYYHICKNNSNVVFYDVENLKLLNEYLKQNNIIKTVDDLLELTCTWIVDSSSEDYALIKILFGSTNICGWQSCNHDKLYNILSMKNNMQKAYIEFIYASIEKIYKTDDARKESIPNILANILKIIEDPSAKQYTKNLFIQTYETLQGLYAEIKSFTSSN
jgi:hypothetical protein